MLGEGFLPWWANIAFGIFIGLVIGNKPFRQGCVRFTNTMLRSTKSHNIARQPQNPVKKGKKVKLSPQVQKCFNCNSLMSVGGKMQCKRTTCNK